HQQAALETLDGRADRDQLPPGLLDGRIRGQIERQSPLSHRLRQSRKGADGHLHAVGLLWMSVAPPATPDLSQFAVLRRPPFLLLSIGLACRNQQDLAGYTAKPLPKRRGDGHARAEQPAVAPARAAQRRPSTRPSAVRGAACWPRRRPAAGLP